MNGQKRKHPALIDRATLDPRDGQPGGGQPERGDGRPHVTPLPAVWSDGALHFCTGPTEQKGVNLAANPACVLTTGNTE